MLMNIKIELESIDQNGGKHLKMKDSNGQEDVDILITKIIKKPGETGKVTWKAKDFDSRIKSIVDILSAETSTIVFKNGAKKINNKMFVLELPIETGVKEKYKIVYIPEGNTESVTIDPYIDIRPR